jgi:hypothetical protein
MVYQSEHILLQTICGAYLPCKARSIGSGLLRRRSMSLGPMLFCEACLQPLGEHYKISNWIYLDFEVYL